MECIRGLCHRRRHRAIAPLASGAAVVLALAGGCRNPETFRAEADNAAYRIVDNARESALGSAEPFTISPTERALRERLLLGQNLPISDPASVSSRNAQLIEQWPDESYFDSPEERPDDPAEPAPGVASVTDVVLLSLIDALQVAARNSRSYQDQKERVYLAALRLDLEADAFRNSWTGVLDTLVSTDLAPDPSITGIANTDALTLSRRFEGGAQFMGMIAVDLVKLLSGGSNSSLGLTADASLSIPLLRGSGRFVVTEPLRQAERDVVYEIYGFERFKRELAVRVASDYLSVLRTADSVDNAAENYRRVGASTRRARRLADAGRLPEIQVDQARQDELRARNNWISAQQQYEDALDRFKSLLGLPTDATIALDRGELNALVNDPRYTFDLSEAAYDTQGDIPAADEEVELVPPSDADAGPLEIPEDRAIAIALNNRLDLRTAIGRIVDAQRGVAIGADNLRADVTLLGTASFGSSRSVSSATSDDAQLDPSDGFYSALLGIDPAFERTSERNSYRGALIGFESAVRNMQQAEDDVKFQVRTALRNLLEARETLKIQAESVRVAQRRVDSTDLFLQAGRAEIRDVLEAQDSLLGAQNALTAALVNYRVSELELQRDLGVLTVDDTGLWQEFDPDTFPQQEGEAGNG
ncbi:MAG: TolC family protein [Phycisphaerales bacterium]